MENENLPLIFLNFFKKKQVTFRELQFSLECRNVPTPSFVQKRFVENLPNCGNAWNYLAMRGENC
jgi:hypothetical protein